MNTEFVREDGRFVPASIPEFSERAKRLAQLVDLPLQAAQEALARIYGFAGLHEGQQVITAGEVCGPYEEDLLALRWEPAEDGLKQIAMRARTARSRRLYEELRKAVEAADGLPRRIADADDAGFFCRPPIHRRKFRRVMAKWAVLDGGPAESAGDRHPAAAYAQYVERPTGGGYLAYTELGQSIDDALSEIRMGYDADRAGYEAALEQLLAAHPRNPWVRTEWLQHNCQACWQGGWADYLYSNGREGYATADAERGFRGAPELARTWYEEARQIIALFESLLPSWDGGARKLGLEDRSYLIALYWGGRTAIHRGLYGVGKRWLGRCLKADARDGMGARYYHGVAALLTGGPRPRGRRPDRQHDAWAWLQELAWDLKAGNRLRAAQALEEALSATPHVLRAIHRRFYGADELRVFSNHDTLAHLQEFMFVTRGFWDTEDEARTWLRRMTQDEGVRAATIALHKARTAARGTAYMEPVVAACRERGVELTRQALTAAVKAAAKAA